jgi:hypothetical protein
MTGPRTELTQPLASQRDPPKKKIETAVPMGHAGSEVEAALRAEALRVSASD